MIELAERDPDLVARRLLEDCRTELERMAAGSRNGGKGDRPEADQALMTEPDIRARFEAAKLETVGRGPEGYARDLFLLYVEPWGFGPEEITVPTQIWHGDEDAAVTPRIAEYFAETIPESRLHMIPGAGHLLLWSHADEILRSLSS